MPRIVRQAVILGSRTGLDQQIARRRRGHRGDRSPPAPERAKPASARAVHQPDQPGRRIGYIEPAAHRQDRPRPPAGFRCGKRPKPVAGHRRGRAPASRPASATSTQSADTDRDKAGVDKAAARSRRGGESQILRHGRARTAVPSRRHDQRPRGGRGYRRPAIRVARTVLAKFRQGRARLRRRTEGGHCRYRQRPVARPRWSSPWAVRTRPDRLRACRASPGRRKQARRRFARRVTIHHDDVAARRDGDARHGDLVGAGKLDRIAVGRSRRRFENQVACVIRGQPDAGSRANDRGRAGAGKGCGGVRLSKPVTPGRGCTGAGLRRRPRRNRSSCLPGLRSTTPSCTRSIEAGAVARRQTMCLRAIAELRPVASLAGLGAQLGEDLRRNIEPVEDNAQIIDIAQRLAGAEQPRR